MCWKMWSGYLFVTKEPKESIKGKAAMIKG